MQFPRFWRALDVATIPLRPFVWVWMRGVAALLTLILPKTAVGYDRGERSLKLRCLADIEQRELGQMEAYADAISLLLMVLVVVTPGLYAPETAPWLLTQAALGVLGLAVIAERMNGDVTATEVLA
jgi:hypothetical protein